MSETYTVHDPFLGKDVQISNRLIDRLRGKYASGPHLPNGNPEFGWRQFQAPPIQHEAAAVIEALVKALEDLDAILDFSDENLEPSWTFEDLTSVRAAFKQAREALAKVQPT